MQKLAEAGYLKYEKYRGLIMTDQGREVARRIQSRHETLSRFFSLFGIEAESQRQDFEGFVDLLSADTVRMLADLADFFEQNPATLRKFQQSRSKSTKKR